MPSVNFRGGQEKSSLAFNLSYELACRNYEVLVVDTCPQGNLSDILLQGDLASVSITIYDALIAKVSPGNMSVPSMSI